MSADMEGVNAISGSTCTMCLHTCDHAQALATQRAELIEQQEACAIDCDWKALNEASVEVFRAELAEGVRGLKGYKLFPFSEQILFDSTEVLALIEGSKG